MTKSIFNRSTRPSGIFQRLRYRELALTALLAAQGCGLKSVSHFSINGAPGAVPQSLKASRDPALASDMGYRYYAMDRAESNDVLWDASSAIDGSLSTAYSSQSFPGSVNERGTYFSAWIKNGPQHVSVISLSARMQSPRTPQAFPGFYDVYLTDPTGTQWSLIGTFSNQPDITGTAIIPLGKTYSTTAIKIVPKSLGKDDFGNFYFQLAEVQMGMPIGSTPISDLNVLNYKTQAFVNLNGTPYDGPFTGGLISQYATHSDDPTVIGVNSPSYFITTGAGDDAIALKSGVNVVNAGGGSNFLVSGSGTDFFFVDLRGSQDVWNTVTNFHCTDAVTLWGVTESGFSFDWQDNQGAAGYEGLTLHTTSLTRQAPGNPTGSVTLTGYTQADRGNGRLTMSFGISGGIDYMMIQANCALQPSPTPAPSPSVVAAFPASRSVDGDPYLGPYSTTQAEYRLPAVVDSDILSTNRTEIWGELYRPVEMGSGPHPVIVLLHGNHETCGSGSNPIIPQGCDYSSSGACPAGQFVIPNHLGYEYLANRLASFGYVVASVNSNLGINCLRGDSTDSGLILARGKLVLKHLSYLSNWNRSGGTPSSLGIDLKGMLDFSQVGLMGHSRGGEGVRAAYNLYQASGSVWPSKIPDALNIRGIFEIAPVDGQSSKVLDATGVAWNVILPSCDGDVANLDGMRPFDRMLTQSSESPALPKSMYAVWGANHNFFNTQWQNQDSPGCTGAIPLWSGSDWSSGKEQQIAVSSMIPFFRSYVGNGANPGLGTRFDPLYSLPADVTDITRIDRSYIDSPNSSYFTSLETFNGSGTLGSLGQAHLLSNASIKHTSVPDHDSSLSAGKVSWNGSGSSTFFQDNWSTSGIVVENTQTLDFRVSRVDDSTLNSDAYTDFHIQLVDSNGPVGAAAALSDYLSLVGPIGSAEVLHETLPTVRIPVSALLPNGGVVTGVRFIFDSTQSGDIYLANIGLGSLTHSSVTVLSRAVERLPEAPIEPRVSERSIASVNTMHPPYPLQKTPLQPVAAPAGNRIARVSRVNLISGWTEIEVDSSVPFPVRDALPELRLNGVPVAVGSLSDLSTLRRMVFQVKLSDFNNLPDLVKVEVGHREDPNGRSWDFGTVSKASLSSP